MPRNTVSFDIEATDNASDKVEEVADAAAKLDGETVDVPVETTGAAKAEQELASVGTAATRAGDDVKKMGADSDQSRSVLANLVGNSAQDLGELGGVAGSAGVALGQLAEYATDGNIALGSLVKTAGPMLAIGVAVGVVVSKLNAAREKAEDLRDANKEIAESLREGKIEEAAQKIVEQYGDVIEAAEELGFSTEDVTKVLMGQAAELPGLTSRMADLEATVTGGEAASADHALALAQEFDALRSLSGELGTASESYAEQSGLLDVNAQRLDEVSAALGGVEDATGDVVTAWQRMKAELDEHASFLSAVDDADALAGSLEELRRLTDEGKEGTEEWADAQRAAETDTNRLQQTIFDLVEEYGRIPESERTRILAELPLAEQAMFGAFMDRVEAEHQADVTVDVDTSAAEGELNRFTEQRRRTEVGVDLIATWGKNRPLGYPPGAPWPPGTRAAASTTNVTVNLPRGMRSSDVIRAVDRYAARNGGRRTVRR